MQSPGVPTMASANDVDRSRRRRCPTALGYPATTTKAAGVSSCCSTRSPARIFDRRHRGPQSSGWQALPARAYALLDRYTKPKLRTLSSRFIAPRAGRLFFESSSRSIFLFEHDLFDKPVPTFPDHALAARLPGRGASVSQFRKHIFPEKLNGPDRVRRQTDREHQPLGARFLGGQRLLEA